MKILLATYWPIPHVGGVWTYMKQLKEKLESYGHEVDLLGYDEDNISVHLYNKGRKLPREKVIPIINANLTEQNYPLIYRNFLVRWTEFQRYVFELSAAYFGLDKYDLIHTQDVLSTTAVSRIKPKHIPHVATIHGSVAHEIRMQLESIHKSETSYMAREYYDDVEKKGATSADITIVCNEWLRNIFLDEFDVPPEKLTVLHYGYDAENFIRRMRIKPALVKPADKKVILYTGRLVELKGLNYLLEALKNLKAIRSDWVCWIVGSGEQEAALKNQAMALGLDQDVQFLGRRDDVPGLLTQSDIFVLPTLIENQPLSVIEAQIAGKAIIASNTGGIPEIIEHGVTGLLTPPKDVNMLTQNLNLLLDNEKYRKQLGSNARKWGLPHWSIEKSTRNLLKIYYQAIDQKRLAGGRRG